MPQRRVNSKQPERQGAPVDSTQLLCTDPVIAGQLDLEAVAATSPRAFKELQDLKGELERLRGLKPELPPRPSEGEGLPRFGIRHGSNPMSVPMPDGYWTPWHLAVNAIAMTAPWYPYALVESLTKYEHPTQGEGYFIRKKSLRPATINAEYDSLFGWADDAGPVEKEAGEKDTDREPRKQTNCGHGHIYTREDGKRIDCGGPPHCPYCTRDYFNMLPANWREDSSLATWFPFTAEELERNKQEITALQHKLEEAGRLQADTLRERDGLINTLEYLQRDLEALPTGNKTSLMLGLEKLIVVTDEALTSFSCTNLSLEKTQDVGKQVHKILQAYFWLPELKANTNYTRRHDDHDGTYQGSLSVLIGEDGDAWVSPVNAHGNGLRFRMPLTGGGESQYTRTALVILAEAIRLDNETRPQSAGRFGKDAP